MTIVRKTLLAVPLVLAAACGGVDTSGTSTVSSLTGDAAAGKTLYVANCQTCHGADAASGTARVNAASVAQTSTAVAIATIQNGQDSMPSFSARLTSQEVADVIAYLKTL